MHTIVEAVAAPRGDGAKARAKRAAQAALLALVLFSGFACRTPETEALTYEFDETKFRALTAALMEQAPLNDAVIVTVDVMDGLYWGQSWYDDEAEAYRIAIESQQPMVMVVDTLLHEWAHLIVWDVLKVDQHDELWGVSYARCYRIGQIVQFGPGSASAGTPPPRH